MLLNFFPTFQRVEYFVRGVLLKIAESGDIFAVEDQQGLFEVEMREVGDESHLLFVLLGELFHGYEFMGPNSGCPDGVDRKEYHIFLPLLQNLALDLGERLEFERIS